MPQAAERKQSVDTRRAGRVVGRIGDEPSPEPAEGDEAIMEDIRRLLAEMKERLDSIDKRFDAVGERFDKMDKRFDKVLDAATEQKQYFIQRDQKRDEDLARIEKKIDAWGDPPRKWDD